MSRSSKKYIRRAGEEMEGRYRRRRTEYKKIPATIDQQLDKLEERGCVIKDRESAKETLTNINYYRLAYYFAVFLEDKRHYRPNTTFEGVVRVYDFDRRLRNLLLNMLEEIEIAMRAYVSNFHALKYGATGYMDQGSFGFNHRHQTFISRMEKIIEANQDNTIVQHHVKKYGGNFPIWAIMELFSFGMLNSFYAELKPADKEEIAKEHFGIPSGTLENWLHCLSELRNHCAHYHRLYANRIDPTPCQPKGVSYQIGNMAFDYILILKALYRNVKHWNQSFLQSLDGMLEEYGDVVELSQLGFPEKWRELLLK